MGHSGTRLRKQVIPVVLLSDIDIAFCIAFVTWIEHYLLYFSATNQILADIPAKVMQ